MIATLNSALVPKSLVVMSALKEEDSEDRMVVKMIDTSSDPAPASTQNRISPNHTIKGANAHLA